MEQPFSLPIPESIPALAWQYRQSLTKESLGVPVLAVGVPTVVSAAAIVYDTVDAMTGALKKNRVTRGLGKYVEGLDPEEQYL
ncbi:MAG: GPR endopeptidase [Clostridium sp.]